MRITKTDDIIKLSNKEIQMVLKAIEFRELTVLLRCSNGAVIEKIRNNLNKNVLEYIDNYNINKSQFEKLNKAIVENILFKINSFFPQKVAIASDHAAFELKEELINHFTDIDFVDFGTSSEESMDYPDTGFEGAEAVANNSCDFGIIMCGSGIGMSIVANKVKGIRAALCQSKEFAQLSRKHNNANVLVIPGRFTAKHIAFDIVDAFLKTKFEGGRHQRRIDKITNYETKKN